MCEALAGCYLPVGDSQVWGAEGTRALTASQLPSPAYVENDPFFWVDGGKLETVCYKVWKAHRELLCCFGIQEEE